VASWKNIFSHSSLCLCRNELWNSTERCRSNFRQGKWTGICANDRRLQPIYRDRRCVLVAKRIDASNEGKDTPAQRTVLASIRIARCKLGLARARTNRLIRAAEIETELREKNRTEQAKPEAQARAGVLESIGSERGSDSELKPVRPEIKTEIPSLKLRLLKEENAEELYLRNDQNRDHLRQWMPWLDETKSASDTLNFIRRSLESATAGTQYHYVFG
jgi:hypothetical protein